LIFQERLFLRLAKESVEKVFNSIISYK
jgi:hypothetical protein